MKTKTAICGLSSSKELAKSLSKKLKFEYIEVEKQKFKNGEMLTQIKNSVRGKNVYVVQSTGYPSSENIMELMIFLDAVKRSSAQSVSVIMPYYGYSRQDRKAKGRQPITAKLISDMIELMGVKRLITFDLHSSQIQGFFDIPVDDLKTIYLIENLINNLKLKDITVVSPDHGGINRARVISKLLNSPITILDKRRPDINKSEVLNVLGEPMNNKNVIIVDDMIDTGGTIINTLKLAEKNGAKSAHVFCTHGIFSDGAIKKIVESKILKSIYMSNTIETNLDDYRKISPKVKIYKIDDLLAKVIDAQVNQNSISNLYKEK